MASNRSHNALTHGFYGREAVLPWESLEDFVNLHRSIRSELEPDGPLEEETVRELAELVWRKRRLAVAFMLPAYKNPPSSELLEAAKGGLTDLSDYLAKAAHQSPGVFTTTTSAAIDYIKRIGANKVAGESPQQALASTPVPTVVERAYDPDALERQLRIEARIDSRIAKILARLVGLKEYKVIYEPQPTEPAPATPELANTTSTRKWGDA
jgi:hypothetical protein